MVVDRNLLDDLYRELTDEEIEKINQIIKEKRVKITKVIYDNKSNFEISSTVEGYSSNYDTYIKAEKNEIENLKCTCAEYEDNLCACKHIIASMKEFAENNKYLAMAKKENEKKEKEKN